MHGTSQAEKQRIKEQMYPEYDQTDHGKTLAIVKFNRKYMKYVFSSEELNEYLRLKKKASKERKTKQLEQARLGGPP